MAATFRGSVLVRVIGILENALDLSTPADILDKPYNYQFVNGTGADQADQMWHDQRTLAASANEDLDLAASLVNPFGTTITFTKIKAIIVRAAAANTNDVVLKQAAANGVLFMLAAGDGILVKPGGIVAWVAPDANGVAVTAGSGDLINVANSGAGTGVTYDVILIGV